jgi:hypothetical protein
MAALLENTNAVAPQPAKSRLPHASLFRGSTSNIFCPLSWIFFRPQSTSALLLPAPRRTIPL